MQSELEQQSLGLNAQLKSAANELDNVFEALRKRGINFINENLSVRRFGRSTNREALQAEFQDVVIGRALRDINEASGDYVNALIDNSRLYWRGVIDRLNQLRDLMEQELSGLDSSIYAEQREALQEAIRIAESELRTYSSGKAVAEMEELFRTNMSAFTTSAAAAVIGLIVTLIAVATPGPVIGIGAAALALPALVIGAPVAAIGSIVALRYYRKVTADTRRDFEQRVDQLKKTYHEALDDLTQRERSRLTQYGKQVLTPVFSRLEVLGERYAAQRATFQGYVDRIETLRRAIEENRS